MPEAFDTLACDLARFQAAHVEGFSRLLHARGLDAQKLVRASDVPAVPTDAFKMARVSAFPAEATPTVFRTSGTTVGARGEHAFRDVTTYDAGAVAFGRWALAPDVKERLAMAVLGPPPEDAPDSSLTHMMARFLEAFGEAPREGAFFLQGEVLDLAALDAFLARQIVSEAGPVLVMATAFAYVHLLDALDDATLVLPAGSRVMQTGGFKGRSREVSGEKLREDLAHAFAVPETSVVGEYGMTELSSQFYEATLRGGAPGVYVEPPWARVVAVDPDTLVEVAAGEVGIARIEDLLNVDSAFAVLTADRVRRVPSATTERGGFELLGRVPGAVPRGCSISIDEILGA